MVFTVIQSFVMLPNKGKWKIISGVPYGVSGFGGLVVSMLASGIQDRGFAPGRSRRIF
jgi:hypothetical protein